MWTKINTHFEPDCLLCHIKTIIIENKCSFPRFKRSRHFLVLLDFHFGIAYSDCIGNESIQLLLAALLASNSTEHLKWQVVAACRFFL